MTGEQQLKFAELKLIMESRGELQLLAEGDSMFPIIPSESVLHLEELREGAIKVFDIIVFEQGGDLICHYVSSINQSIRADHQPIIVTKSWKKKREDLPVPFGHILGVVTNFKIPLWRKLFSLPMGSL